MLNRQKNHPLLRQTTICVFTLGCLRKGAYKLFENILGHHDLGPWGCSLIFSQSNAGERVSVHKYEMQAAPGFGIALSHFKERLAEVNLYKEAIAVAQ